MIHYDQKGGCPEWAFRGRAAIGGVLTLSLADEERKGGNLIELRRLFRGGAPLDPSHYGLKPIPQTGEIGAVPFS